jgi:SH3-like domain-containing protein
MLRNSVFLLIGWLCAAMAPGSAAAQGRSTGDGLPVPRYVSLRSEEVNVRTGPGVRYPVEWVFNRRNMPVEVVEQFEHWRKIRDIEGTEGWVHQSMLSGKRHAIVTGDVRSLRRRPEAGSPEVARLEPGVIAQLIECQGQFCRVEAGGIKGWLPRAEFWGVYPSETLK